MYEIRIKIQKSKDQNGGESFMLDKIALTLLIIGGLNWGLVGIFQFDLIAWIFGGQTAIISRIIYAVVAVCAIWCISLLFRERALQDDSELSENPA